MERKYIMSATAFRIIILLFAAYSTDVCCVKITNLKVPEYFIISDDSPDHVVLDCEYEIDDNDTGLVVKWQKNGLNIYQWIYGQNPTALPHMKGKINESFVASNEKMHQYRALVLMNPSTDATGDYKCLVAVAQNFDAKSSHLEILDFRNFSLELNHKEVDDDIQITCEAQNVFPKPTLRISLNKEDNLPITTQEIELEEDGYFDASVTGTLSNDGIDADTLFWCLLSFDGINYTDNRYVKFSGENEQFSFLEQTKNNLTIPGSTGSRSTFNLNIALTVLAPLIFAIQYNAI